MEMKFKTEIVLYASYFDFNDNISTKSILNIFQDVASIHAEELGIGYLPMLKQNLYWVLSRIKVDIIKMPQVNETVIVETWPLPKGRIDFDRDLRITNKKGETLIIGTSKWCVIDTVSRMLQRTDNVNYNGEYYPQRNYQEKFTKVILPNNNLNFKFTHKVLNSHLDHNKHMNNTNYANLVFDAVENKSYKHFEINFNSEAILKDEIQVLTTKNNNEEYVVGRINDVTCFTAFVV